MIKEIKMVSPSELVPMDGNPRRHPDDMLERLEKSMKEFGFIAPIIALSKTKEILAGHGRLKGAQRLGLKKVPVMFVNLSKKKALAYNIADNKVQESSEWDFGNLKDILEELDDGQFDLESTGFLESEIEELFTRYGDEYGEEFDLPDEDKGDFETITFTLSTAQAGNLRYALNNSMEEKDRWIESNNSNSNGNAMSYICERFNALFD